MNNTVRPLPAVVLMSARLERCDEAAGLNRSRVHELADHLATDLVTHFSSHSFPVTYIARDFTVYRVLSTVLFYPN